MGCSKDSKDNRIMDGPEINNTNLGMTSYVSGLRSSLKSLYHIGPYLKVRVCAERKGD